MDTVTPGSGHPTRGFSFDAGEEIALEFRSDAGPLPTHRWTATVSARPLNVDGTLQHVVADPSWFRPISYAAQTGLSVVGDTYVLNVGMPAPGGFRWTVRIPPQASTHGNTSFRWINVYQRRSGL